MHLLPSTLISAAAAAQSNAPVMVPESGIPPPPAALLTPISTGATSAVNYSFSKATNGSNDTGGALNGTVAPTPNGNSSNSSNSSSSSKADAAAAPLNAFTAPLGFNGVERECARDDLLRAFRRAHEHAKRLRAAAQVRWLGFGFQSIETETETADHRGCRK
jgi:hypothetical protein